MKLIAETHDAKYLLQIKGTDGEVLATASAESGGNPVPSRFFIWEEQGPDDEGIQEDYEGEHAVQQHRVKEGQDPDAIWEQVIEFETYRVAMAVWDRQREQEAREVKFLKLVTECQESFIPTLDRMLSIHFDLLGEDISAAVMTKVQTLHNHIKQAAELADMVYDPPKK
jgi:hypothetical protein